MKKALAMNVFLLVISSVLIISIATKEAEAQWLTSVLGIKKESNIVQSAEFKYLKEKGFICNKNKRGEITPPTPLTQTCFRCEKKPGFLLGYGWSPIQCPEEKCTDEYKPVCGSDGKTYSNKCKAKKAGVKWTEGKCCKKDTDCWPKNYFPPTTDCGTFYTCEKGACIVKEVGCPLPSCKENTYKLTDCKGQDQSGNLLCYGLKKCKKGQWKAKGE